MEMNSWHGVGTQNENHFVYSTRLIEITAVHLPGSIADKVSKNTPTMLWHVYGPVGSDAFKLYEDGLCTDIYIS